MWWRTVFTLPLRSVARTWVVSPSAPAVYYLVVGHLSSSREQPWGPPGRRVVAGRPRGSVGSPPLSHADTDAAAWQVRYPPPSHLREEIQELTRKFQELEGRKREEEDEPAAAAPEVGLSVFPRQGREAGEP